MQIKNFEELYEINENVFSPDNFSQKAFVYLWHNSFNHDTKMLIESQLGNRLRLSPKSHYP